MSTPDSAGSNPSLQTSDSFLDWSIADDFEIGHIDTADAERVLANLLPPPRLPENIGKFKVVSLLGHGSYGWVYKARDPLTNRFVAVKVPRLPSRHKPSGIDAFLHEARATHGDAHPNFVTVLEVGEYGDSFFIAYVFVEGPTLRSWLRRHDNAIGWRAAAALVHRLASAIASVHDLGIVHRDLKPENILLAPARTDEFGFCDGVACWTPRIADFGLARLPDDSDPSHDTQARAGTLAYQPPEQVGGEGPISYEKGDIHALGVILYESLVGHLPYQAETREELERQIREHPPVSPRAIRPELPRDIETICLKALEKDPSRRYESAHALSEDLRRALRNEPILARPISLLERVLRWTRHNPGEAGWAIFAGSLAALLLLGVFIYMRVVELANAQLAEQTRALAREVVKRDQAVENDRLHLINQHLKYDRSELADELLDDLEQSNRELSTAPSFTARYLRHVANRKITLMQGHTGAVDQLLPLARTRGPRKAVSLSMADKSIRLWNLDEGVELAKHDIACAGMVVAPDGTSIWVVDRVCADEPDEISLIHLDTEALRPIDAPFRLRGVYGMVSVAALGDGRLLIAGSGQTEGRIWDPRTRKWTGVARFGGNPVQVVAPAHGEKIAALIEVTGRHAPAYASFCPTAGSDLDFELYPHTRLREVTDLFMTAAADGSLFVTVDHMNMHFYYLDDAMPPRHRTNGVGLQTNGTMALSPDGGLHAYANTRYQTIELTHMDVPMRHRPNMGQYKRLFYGDHEPMSLEFTPDGADLLMTARDDNRAWVWHIEPPPEEESAGTTEVSDMAFTPNGKYLVIGDSSRRVAAFEWFEQHGHVLRQHHAWPDDEVSAIAVSGDGQLVASGVWDVSGKITLHKFDSMAPLATLDGHTDAIRDVAFSPTRKWLASASKDCSVILWDMDTLQMSRVLHTFKDRARCVAFFPDGRRLAMAGQDGLLLVNDLENGQELLRVQCSAGINALAISPAGDRLAYGQDDGTLVIHEIATGKSSVIEDAHGGKDGMMSLAFHPNGVELASGGADGTVAVWNVITRWEMFREQKHVGEVPSVLFSPDGTRLISAGRDGKLCFFLTTP